MKTVQEFQILRPIITEKTYQAFKKNQYEFEVPSSSNKDLIAKAVKEKFDVDVINVNVLVRKGKAKKSVKKRVQAINGVRKNRKFAIVTIKAGQKLPFFEEVES